MAVKTQQIYADNPGALADAVYVLPPGLDLDLHAVRARVSGAGASGSFIMVCELLTSDNHILAQSPIDQALAVADTGALTWAPFLRAAGASAGIGPPYKTLFDETLAAPAATIDTTGTDLSGGNILEVWVFGRCTGAFNAADLNIQYNGLATNIYDFAWVRNFGGVVGVIDGQSQTAFSAVVPGTLLPAGVFSTTRMTIPNYANTTYFKTAEFSSGLASATNIAFDRTLIGSSVFRSTAAVSSVQISTAGGNLDTGTRLLVLSR